MIDVRYQPVELPGDGPLEDGEHTLLIHPAGAITRLPNAHPDIESATCGMCTDCCTVLDGDFRPLLAEYKPKDTPCPMLFPPESGLHGCRAYQARPSCCRTFKCWALILVQLGEAERYQSIAHELSTYGFRTYKEAA